MLKLVHTRQGMSPGKLQDEQRISSTELYDGTHRFCTLCCSKKNN